METLLCYIASVPDTIWAAIIAATITLLGVYLTNRHYANQQTKQLEHERDENERNRKLDLRKYVYLEAAEELVVAIQHVMNLSRIDLTKVNPADELENFFKSTAKASLVASDETASKINHLLSAFNETFFSLLPELKPIQDARTKRDIENNLYERHQAEVNRILATMAQFNEEAKADPNIWNALSSSFDFNSEQAAKAADTRNTAWTELNTQKQIFAKKAITQIKDVAALIPIVLTAIRSELDIPTDIHMYEQELNQRYNRADELLDELFKKIKDE